MEPTLEPNPDDERRTVVVVTGGEPPIGAAVDAALADVPEAAVIVAADSGVHHAALLGLAVHHAVGDFDSADPDTLAALEAAGTEVVAHPVDKDATDLELALGVAEDLGARRVVVLGGGGGRLDHLLGNLLVLAAPRFANLVVDAALGAAAVHVARPWAPTVLHGRPGDLVTLLPAHGPAVGVVTDGLLYPLDHELLVEGSTRGLSNELAAPRAEVRLNAGCLLVVRPGGRGTHHDLGLRASPPSPTD